MAGGSGRGLTPEPDTTASAPPEVHRAPATRATLVTAVAGVLTVELASRASGRDHTPFRLRTWLAVRIRIFTSNQTDQFSM